MKPGFEAMLAALSDADDDEADALSDGAHDAMLGYEIGHCGYAEPDKKAAYIRGWEIFHGRACGSCGEWIPSNWIHVCTDSDDGDLPVNGG